MRRIIIIIVAIVVAAMQSVFANPSISLVSNVPTWNDVAQQNPEVQRNVAEKLISDYTSTITTINQIQQSMVEKELKLTTAQKVKFGPIYKAYRKAIEDCAGTIDRNINTIEMSDAELIGYLKTKLANIAAVANVKRQYIDKFATVIDAEQIRKLYNTEGKISSQIKQNSANRTVVYSRSSNRNRRLKGSGNLVTQNLGNIRAYSELSTKTGIAVTISETAKEVILTADDNIINHVLITNNNGVLSFSINADHIENPHVSVVVPYSATLSRVKSSSSSSVTCNLPIKGNSVELKASSSGRITLDAEATGALDVQASSSGKIQGSMRCNSAEVSISSSGRVAGNMSCNDKCKLWVSSSGKFAGNITSRSAVVEVASSGNIETTLVATGGTAIRASSSGKIGGSISAKQCNIQASSCGLIAADFKADSFDVEASSSGKISLLGSSVATTGKVMLSSGASFSAPNIQVGTYTLVSVSSSSKADVYCTGELSTYTSSGGKITYDGKCRVISNDQSVVRK